MEIIWLHFKCTGTTYWYVNVWHLKCCFLINGTLQKKKKIIQNVLLFLEPPIAQTHHAYPNKSHIQYYTISDKGLYIRITLLCLDRSDNLLPPTLQESSAQRNEWPFDPHTQGSFLHAANEFRFLIVELTEGWGTTRTRTAIYHNDSTNKMVVVCHSCSGTVCNVDVSPMSPCTMPEPVPPEI